jgi:hypothetical protein
MAAIAMADELADARARVAALEAEASRLGQALAKAEGASRDLEARAANAIFAAAERVGQMGAALGRPVTRDELP